jgi:hypothetical protein
MARATALARRNDGNQDRDYGPSERLHLREIHRPSDDNMITLLAGDDNWNCLARRFYDEEPLPGLLAA